MVRRGAAWCGVVRRGAARCGVVRRGAAWCGAVRRGAWQQGARAVGGKGEVAAVGTVLEAVGREPRVDLLQHLGQRVRLRAAVKQRVVEERAAEERAVEERLVKERVVVRGRW